MEKKVTHGHEHWCSFCRSTWTHRTEFPGSCIEGFGKAHEECAKKDRHDSIYAPKSDVSGDQK